MMTREEFIAGFAAHGLKEEGRKDFFVIFSYTVPVGKFAGQKIRLAFEITGDMPLIPPGGPHVSPRLLPIHPAHDLPHPNGAVCESPSLGPEWEYWSRPFHRWQDGERDSARYMRHINRLFDTQ